MTHKERITIETLDAGQPRAYADTIHRVRVSFESNGYLDGDLLPSFMSEDAARRRLRAMQCGFTEKTRADSDWFDTHLDWLRPIDAKTANDVIPHGDPNQTVASIWEFHTTSAYTD